MFSIPPHGSLEFFQMFQPWLINLKKLKLIITIRLGEDLISFIFNLKCFKLVLVLKSLYFMNEIVLRNILCFKRLVGCFRLFMLFIRLERWWGYLFIYFLRGKFEVRFLYSLYLIQNLNNYFFTDSNWRHIIIICN